MAEKSDQQSTDAPESALLPIDTISVADFAEIFNHLARENAMEKYPFITRHNGYTLDGELPSFYNTSMHRAEEDGIPPDKVTKKKDLTGYALVINTIHQQLRSYALQVGLLFDEKQLPEEVQRTLSEIDQKQSDYQKPVNIDLEEEEIDQLVYTLKKQLEQIDKITITLGKGDNAHKIGLDNKVDFLPKATSGGLAGVLITLHRAPTSFLDYYKVPEILSTFYHDHIGVREKISGLIGEIRMEIEKCLAKEHGPAKAATIMKEHFPDLDRAGLKKLIKKNTPSLQFNTLCGEDFHNLIDIKHNTNNFLNLIGEKVEVPEIETVVEMAIVINAAEIITGKMPPLDDEELLENFGNLGDISLTENFAENALSDYLQHTTVKNSLTAIFKEADRVKEKREPDVLETLLVQAVSRLEETGKFSAIRTEMGRGGGEKGLG